MTNFISTMQTGTKYRVCLSQQGMELKVVLLSLTHYSDGHSVEINLKAIFKGSYFYSEESFCLFPATKNTFFSTYFLYLVSLDNTK